MELLQLRYFLEVAETQHMTLSAERLHISQPTLSQTIHRLEEKMGVPLFTHKGRNIALTEYGRYLQKRLTPLMDQLDKLPEQLQTMAKLNRETIHLNVLAASKLVTEAIIQYKLNFPDLNFQLLQNTQSDIFDIEISTRLLYQAQPSMSETVYVCEEPIYLAVPNNAKFAGKRSVRLVDVKDEGFISLIGSREFRYICDRFCHHAGVHPRVIFESDNPAAVRNMIAANMGVGFWPAFSWGEIDSEHVRLLSLEEPHCSRDIVISHLGHKKDNRCVEDFFEFLKKFFSEQRDAAQAALAKES